ncbi:response regulator [Radicibacter daui]|uniref:response regulator n=1 Tax=Radicibacter daui TaxID=3064829 RepID=UPI0040468AF7
MRVLLADDHDLVRDALKDYVERLDPSITVMTCSSLGEAMERVNDLGTGVDVDLDLVLLDLNMPGMDGLTGLERMIDRLPDTPVCLISGSMSRKDVMRALDLGAAGFLPKTLSGKALLNALRLIISGEVFVPATVVAGGVEGTRADIPTDEIVPAPETLALTPREREVLSHLAKGWSNKEIARALDLQEVTIKLHVRGVFRKLEVRNRTQAARKAADLGLVD